MAQSKSLSLDPEELLQFMDTLDSDFSDDDFEGYTDEDEWLEETMSRRISVYQNDGSRNSVVSEHGSRLGQREVRMVMGRRGSENGDGMDGSENGDGTNGSKNGDGTDGSKNDRMDSDGENSGSDDHANTYKWTSSVRRVIPDMMGK